MLKTHKKPKPEYTFTLVIKDEDLEYCFGHIHKETLDIKSLKKIMDDLSFVIACKMKLK